MLYSELQRKVLPPYPCVHGKSLWRFTVSFRVCHSWFTVTLICVLPVSERWLVLHRRSNFRFHTHRSFPPDSQTSSLWRNVKHCKIWEIYVSWEVHAFIGGFKICPKIFDNLSFKQRWSLITSPGTWALLSD